MGSVEAIEGVLERGEVNKIRSEKALLASVC